MARFSCWVVEWVGDHGKPRRAVFDSESGAMAHVNGLQKAGRTLTEDLSPSLKLQANEVAYWEMV